jgi:putative YphP/YqiW family bacilliredoxin
MQLPVSKGLYPEEFIAPMRAELTNLGFEQLMTPEAVDAKMTEKGTTLLVVNSMCGCAARMARPGIKLALEQSPTKPTHLVTVFAGQEREATDKARGYFTGYPPSSPSIGLLRDGKLVYMMERWQIEGRPATDIAADLVDALKQHG